MSAVALGDGQSEVTCTDGAQGDSCGTSVYHWNTGTTQTSDECSSNVFVNSKIGRAHV